jgi:hypothetical protein
VLVGTALLDFGWGGRVEFSQSQISFEKVAAPVNWPPEFIYLAGRKYDGSASDTTNGQLRSRHGHGLPYMGAD